MNQGCEGSEVLNSLARVTSAGHETRMDASVILLFGCTGTGKTSFANIASGSEMEVGKGIRSSTQHLEASKVFQVDDQPVVVVDCPGFNDTYLTETEILRRLAEFLIKAYESKYKVAGLLYVHKISDTRVGGASFRHMNMFKALCGSDAFKNVVYVTNMWSEPPTEDETLREEELRNTDEFFGQPLANGAQMARHNNTPESALNIIRKILGRGQVVTKLQRQLVDDKIPLEETAVGLVIGKDLANDLLKQQKEMDELKAEKEKALGTNNQNWLSRLEAQEERTRIKKQQLVAQLQALKINKTKQLDTSQQTRAIQERAIVSGVSAVQEQEEAKMYGPTRIAKHPDDQPDVYSSKQKEWNQRMDEETAREVARIKAMTARSRHRATGRRTFGNIVCDLFAGTGNAMLSLGAALNPGVNHDPSSTAVEDNSRAYPTHGPAMENIRDSYGSPSSLPTQRLDTPDMGGQQGQISGGSQSYQRDGNSRAPSSRKQPHQDYQDSRVPGHRYHAPANE
ncbi:unnamed protein product [Rhizoctonia solani]|uniref:G domain-containing protein n=1 Tax=Rhizoctonia solani TaxID=456999 RepID=A0A8H3GPD0_9AGAM|nr:unnamed protein product [Rhizoctonia solani]